MSSKIKVPVAAPTGRPFILDETHYTTLGFNQLIPVYAREVYPGDKFTINPQVFARAAVPSLPSLADITLKMHAIYVPFSQVWLPFNDFINGVPHATSSSAFGTLSSVPTVSSTELLKFLYTIANGYSIQTPVVNSVEATSDFIVRISDHIYKRQFTLKGKIAYKILTSLGYNINFDNSHVLQLSVLPLLCFFKGYLDYFVPSRFQQSHPLYLVMKQLRDDNTSFTAANLVTLFDNFFLYANGNYFTSAWLTPNAPAPNLNNFAIQVANSQPTETNSLSGLSTDSNGAVSSNDRVTKTYPTSDNSITDVGLKMLTKFSNFIRRNNFVGSRSIERLLARFGVHAPEQIMDMCQYLGSVSTPIQNIEVTANSTSSDGINSTEIGDYVGMQYIDGKFDRNFRCDVQRHGMLFVYASLGVPSMFVDGIRRYVKHITPTSFYTPEFDGGILQAIGSDEYVGRISCKTVAESNTLDSFKLLPSYSMGYTERYSECKTAIDNVDGDFIIPRLSNPLDSFVLPRRVINQNDYLLSTNSLITDYINFSVSDSDPFSQSKVMTQEDSKQFNRIFRDLDGFADPYYLRFEFKVTANRRMLNSDETAELLGYGHEDKMFDNAGVNLN